MKTAIFCVNGINTIPGDHKNWNFRAVNYINNSPAPLWGVLDEYLSGPGLSRVFGQKARKAALAELLKSYPESDWNLILVGHSNGADVIFDTLTAHRWPIVKAVHLFSAACGADMAKLGINKALIERRIGLLRIYTSTGDMVLKLAGNPISRLFGFGQLGRTGPINLSPGAQKFVEVVPRNEFGHSDWWSAKNFGWSMEQILQHS